MVAAILVIVVLAILSIEAVFFVLSVKVALALVVCVN
jgi:hypothetical protein